MINYHTESEISWLSQKLWDRLNLNAVFRDFEELVYQLNSHKRSPIGNTYSYVCIHINIL